jgi:hypothetical protein
MSNNMTRKTEKPTYEEFEANSLALSSKICDLITNEYPHMIPVNEVIPALFLAIDRLIESTLKASSIPDQDIESLGDGVSMSCAKLLSKFKKYN